MIFTTNKIMTIMSIGLMVLLIAAVPSSVTAHGDETEIDIVDGYTSQHLELAWNKTMEFSFEVPTANMNFTFEITNLNGSMYMYDFDAETESAAGLTLSHGDEDTGTDTHFNEEGLPMDHHVSDHVLRHVTFPEAGNYTLTFSDAHEHLADPIGFVFSFQTGFHGDEIYGNMEMGASDTGSSPVLGLLQVVGSFAVLVLVAHRRKISL